MFATHREGLIQGYPLKVKFGKSALPTGLGYNDVMYAYYWLPDRLFITQSTFLLKWDSINS